MVIKVSLEQLRELSCAESQQYINKLHQLIIKHSPGFKEDPHLLQRLNDADDFVKKYCFTDKEVMTDFIITNAYEPYFYKNLAVERWLLEGSESVESEYIKYQQIKYHLISRTVGDNL